MWRAIVTAVALAAASAPAASAGCTASVAWHGTRYKQAATRERVAPGARIGTGTVVPCATTGGGLRRVGVYAVPGVRSRVAVAARAGRPALYLSGARPTAAERRVLDRLRGR
jgi:hypothetical protein